MRLSRIGWFLAAAIFLAGCGGGDPWLRKSVFPPRASIQQLEPQADGGWKLQLRLQNFSSVSMTFDSAQGTLEVAGHPAGEVSVTPSLRIGPESADVVDATLKPSPDAARAVDALHGTGSVRYKLTGKITTSHPSGEHPYTFEGVLTPVPGLVGVLR